VGSPKGWAESSQRSWDQLEEELVRDRDVRLGVLLDVVEAVCGASPMIVDLGCGPGTVTCRLLDRLPGAGSPRQPPGQLRLAQLDRPHEHVDVLEAALAAAGSV
jgi:hypothetical protein